MTKRGSSKPRQTLTPSWEKTSVKRLYKRIGVRRISWIYKHVDGRSETLKSSPVGDRDEYRKAENAAVLKAAEIQQGRVVAGSVAAMINKFEVETDPTHYVDQSKNGKANRKAAYENLKRFFGAMSPRALRAVHGYQFLEARAKAGAPARANKEMAQMSTICHYGVRWALMDANPFQDLMLNKYDTDMRVTSRRQVVRFYLWAVRQRQAYRTMGCAALFCYLTGFRAAEVRPFPKSGIVADGVFVIGAKRKKGEGVTRKLRHWSMKLRCVVARSQQRRGNSSALFAATRRGKAYSKSGWSSTWQDAMLAWISTFDPRAADLESITHHSAYFALSDVRPAAITHKFEQRSEDVYDFAAHATPATTHKSYDRRRVRQADATE